MKGSCGERTDAGQERGQKRRTNPTEEPVLDLGADSDLYQVRMRLKDSEDPALGQEVVGSETPAGLEHTQIEYYLFYN